MSPVPFSLEPAQASDFDALLALRLRAMRESLEQLGRYDEGRARERLAAGFVPEATQHIVSEGRRVGFLVLKHHSQALRLEHLYLAPEAQGAGLGGRVLRQVCEQADREQLPVELVALKGSAANRFYLRHGFVAMGEGEWDVDYLRLPLNPGVRAVRGLWQAMQARDWAAARTHLRDDLQARWWTSAERFSTADAFIEVQRAYPQGWTIHLLECEHMKDNRVMTLLRVDHPPHSFFCTSIARLDDGVIFALDEYWATLETPPAWRTPQRFAGLHRFDPLADPRCTQGVA